MELFVQDKKTCELPAHLSECHFKNFDSSEKSVKYVARISCDPSQSSFHIGCLTDVKYINKNIIFSEIIKHPERKDYNIISQKFYQNLQ